MSRRGRAPRRAADHGRSTTNASQSESPYTDPSPDGAPPHMCQRDAKKSAMWCMIMVRLRERAFEQAAKPRPDAAKVAPTPFDLAQCCVRKFCVQNEGAVEELQRSLPWF